MNSSSSQSQGSANTHSRGSSYALALAALGVVYGDIGTSPLYALREVFHGPHSVNLTESSVLGILSLVFWTLIIVISIKYMVFVLRADNRGEGGILALTALAAPQRAAVPSVVLLMVGILGAALLYSDGALTPAISVLSAVEGLKLATPVFEPFVVPLTVVILVGIFAVQKHGTGRIGAVFGPIMVVWFTTLGILGIGGIVSDPTVFRAINPMYAFHFIEEFRFQAFYAIGSLFLVVTGGEALYADMGHFGKSPIRKAWFTLVLPGLLLNYFGQGALLLTRPEAAENPFYFLAPSWALYPLIALATAATVIASQALISGVFSLTRQAIQLGLCPRLQIVHTSSKEIGQIYLPQMNWALFLGCIWFVINFKSSSALAAAYGISVSATMVITTILMYFVARRVWKWPFLPSFFLMFGFVIIDAAFVGANLLKIADGGYIPIVIAVGIYILMSTWRRGRQILAERLRASVIQIDSFLSQIKTAPLTRVPGVAIFMVGDAKTTPPAMVHNVKHNKVIHDLVVILTVVTKEIPSVPLEERIEIVMSDDRIHRVIARYGFMDTPDVMEIVDCINRRGIKFNVADITFFLGRETLIASENPGMAIWREHLFSFLSRNAQRATAFFSIPADQVVEVGIQVEI